MIIPADNIRKDKDSHISQNLNKYLKSLNRNIDVNTIEDIYESLEDIKNFNPNKYRIDSFELFYILYNKNPEAIKTSPLPPVRAPSGLDFMPGPGEEYDDYNKYIEEKENKLLDKYRRKGWIKMGKNDVFHVMDLKVYYKDVLILQEDAFQKATGSYRNSVKGYHQVKELNEEGAFGEWNVTVAVEFLFEFSDGFKYLRKWINMTKEKPPYYIKRILDRNKITPKNSNLDMIIDKNKEKTVVVIDWESEPFPPFSGGA